jgi:hypothetical protein
MHTDVCVDDGIDDRRHVRIRRSDLELDLCEKLPRSTPGANAVRRLVTGLAAATLIAATAACDPALLLPADPPPVQAPGSTVIEGDSIDVQWATSGGTDGSLACVCTPATGGQ